VKLGLLDEEVGDREGSTSRGGRDVPPGQRRGVEREAAVGRTEGGCGIDTAEEAPWGRRGRGAGRGGGTGEGAVWWADRSQRGRVLGQVYLFEAPEQSEPSKHETNG
jgi:hypothetical protein